MDRRARYCVTRKTQTTIWLTDRNGGLSITNDVNRVVSEVVGAHGDMHIVYRNALGDWNEIVHIGPRFVAFAPARDMAL